MRRLFLVLSSKPVAEAAAPLSATRTPDGRRPRVLLIAALLGAVGCGARPDPAGAPPPSSGPTTVKSLGRVLDVADFGAVPAGDGGAGVDSYPAFQAAVNQACLNTGVPPIFIPEGTFLISQPIRLNCVHTEIFGASRQLSVVQPTFNGPAIVIQDASLSTPLGPALVGSGFSFTTPSPAPTWIDLRDVPSVELDGLSSFTAEAFFEETSSVGGPFIVASNGCVGNNGAILPGAHASTCSSAFSIEIGASNNVVASMTLDGQAIPAIVSAANTVALNRVYHVALTYDGSTVRFFLGTPGGPSTLVGSANAAGTLTQSVFEGVSVGALAGGFRNIWAWNSVAGSVDSVRLSNTARYSAPFTVPTTKLSSDANTLALANFDGQPPPAMVQVWSNDVPYLVPTHFEGYTPPGNATLRNFRVHGGMGIYALNAGGSVVNQIDCADCDGGFEFNHAFEALFDDLYASAGSNRGRYGLFVSGDNSSEFHNLILEGQQLPFAVSGGAQNVITDVNVSPGEGTAYGIVMYGNDAKIDGLTVGGGGGVKYRAGAAFVAGPSYVRPVVLRAAIDGPGALGTSVPIVFDGSPQATPLGPSLLVQDSRFTNTWGTPDLVFLNTPGTAPTIMYGVTSDANAPLSNDPALVTGVVPGPEPTAALPDSDPGATTVLTQSEPSNVFDVTSFGAAPCSPPASGAATCVAAIHDDSAAVQAAVDAACARGNATVFFPAGKYGFSKPVLVNCPLEIDGVSEVATVIQSMCPVANCGGAFPRAPAFVVEPASMTGLDTATWPFGSGVAMKTDGSSYWVNLHDTPAVDLGTTAVFTVEAVVDLTAPSSGYAGIVQSHGCLGSGGGLPGCTSAFQLGVMDQKAFATINVGGTPIAITGSVLPLNTPVYLALTYDGSAVTLWVNQQQAAPPTSVGTPNVPIRQTPLEDVTVGAQTNGFDGLASAPAITGLIDSVRISNKVEYSGAVPAPTGKLAGDSNTLVLLNFDVNVAGTTHGEAAYATPASSGGTVTPGDVWLPIRRTAEPNGAAESTVAVTIKGLEMQTSTGIFAANAARSRFVRVSTYGAYDGVLLTGDNTGSVLDQVSTLGPGATGTSRYGLLVDNPNGALVHNLASRTLAIPLAMYGGSSVELNDVSLMPSSDALLSAAFVQSDDTIHGLFLDMEFGTALDPRYLGDVVVDHSTAPFVLVGGELDTLGNTPVPDLLIDNGSGYLLEGTTFGGTNAPPVLVHVNAPDSAGSLRSLIGVRTQPGYSSSPTASGSRITDDLSPNLRVVAPGSS